MSKSKSVEHIASTLANNGWAFAPATTLCDLIAVSEPDRRRFAEFWHDLGEDRFMADGGRYRKRRHAAFKLDEHGLERLPHRPHFQSRDYNPLNGGIERHFDGIANEALASPVFTRLLDVCRGVFDLKSGPWLLEVHQFRIEPSESAAGRPTPEGMHRDGVDWVAVVLIARVNVAEGVTRISADNGETRFTLSEPFDAVVLDDHRVYHGVTPIHRIDPASPGHRDVLVLTFAAYSDGPPICDAPL